MKKLLNDCQNYYQKHRGGILFVSFFWIVYIFLNAGLYYRMVHNFKDLFRIFINYPLFGLIVFLPFYLVLREFIFKKKYWQAFLSVIIITIVFLLARYVLNIYIFPWLNITTPYDNVPFSISEFLADSTFTYINNIILAFGYGFAKHAIDLERRERKLMETNAQLQRERVMAEMAFLQAQINPHFLYNTLNFIYSEAIMVSDTVSESVLTLSNIMRYTLTEAGSHRLVPLRSEINHIKNYMLLQQMRFGNELQIEMAIEGDENIDHLDMLPLVLISFVENVFKHGEIRDPAHPAQIFMRVEENSFFLYVYNRKNKGPKEQSTGVGMRNILTRMDILYVDKYDLEMLLDTEDEFSLNFIITDMDEGYRNLEKYRIFKS